MSADAARSVLPRVRHVRHVRHNVPSQASPRGLTLKAPIVFMSADAARSVLPRVRPVRLVRLVRHNVPIQQARIISFFNFDFYSFTVEVLLYTVYIIAELCSKRQRMCYGKT